MPFHLECAETDRHRAVTSHYGRYRFTTCWTVEQEANRELVKYMRGDITGGEGFEDRSAGRVAGRRSREAADSGAEAFVRSKDDARAATLGQLLNGATSPDTTAEDGHVRHRITWIRSIDRVANDLMCGCTRMSGLTQVSSSNRFPESSQ